VPLEIVWRFLIAGNNSHKLVLTVVVYYPSQYCVQFPWNTTCNQNWM